ncbi:hypothetical protein ACEWY4_021536 [Coilia grayii]|uniref:Integrase zinc-binding domain-containing protein n=1 Tax=Coilia grayii TaxID=363190 RepID=A0ABD1JCL3_9TELE
MQLPDTIYAILKQHLGDFSYSCMPLADFYNTLPRPHENPVDYWVRLNKAADIADECLQRQGRRMEDLNREVAMMFVRNCPDPALSVVFKSKLVDSWTAKEVQVRIDEYQRELKSMQSKTSIDHQTRQALAVVSDVMQTEATGQERTLHLVKQRFFWSTVERDMRNYVKCCSRCVLSKTPEPEGRAPLESIKMTGPLQLGLISTASFSA